MATQSPRIPSPADLVRLRLAPASPRPSQVSRGRRLAAFEHERARSAARSLVCDPATDFAALDADEFFAALRYACQEGVINAALIGDALRRIAAGAVASRDLHQVLFVAGAEPLAGTGGPVDAHPVQVLAPGRLPGVRRAHRGRVRDDPGRASRRRARCRRWDPSGPRVCGSRAGQRPGATGRRRWSSGRARSRGQPDRPAQRTRPDRRDRGFDVHAGVDGSRPPAGVHLHRQLRPRRSQLCQLRRGRE